MQQCSFIQGAQLSPTDPRDAVSQMRCCPTVAVEWITHTDRMSVWEALSAIATLHSATCIVLYCTRIVPLSSTTVYSTASMRCSVSQAWVSRWCH